MQIPMLLENAIRTFDRGEHKPFESWHYDLGVSVGPVFFLVQPFLALMLSNVKRWRMAKWPFLLTCTMARVWQEGRISLSKSQNLKRVFDIAHSGGEWQSTVEGGQCTLKLIGMNVKLVAFSMTSSCSCNPPVSSSLHRAFLSKSWDVAMQDYSLFFAMQMIFVPTVFVYSILHLCIVLFASLRIPCTRWTVSLENVANAGSVRNTGLSDGQLETSLDFIRLVRCTADRDENHQHHRAWFLVQSCPKSGTKVVWGCKEKQGSPWVRNP